jgi:hypothetical protein
MTGTSSGEKRSGFHRLAVVAGMLAVSSHVLAVPGRIVILRHGGKQDKYALCDVGRERSLALGVQYLGGHTADSVLPSEGPAALLAITLHTLGNPGSAVPTGFRMLKQVYAAPYDDLRSNDWGKKPELPSGSECKE